MPPTLREKTAETRRQHILKAAARAFAANGFRGATIRDVAREAGVADGTIYNAFENKAALLRGLLDPLDENSPQDAPPLTDGQSDFIGDLIARRWATFTPDALAILRVLLAEALADPDIRAEVLDRLIRPPIDFAEPVIEAQIAAGHLAPLEPALVARTLTALMIGLVMLRLLGEPGIERAGDEVPEFLAKLLKGGMLPDGVEACARGSADR